MKDQFYELADYVGSRLKGDEVYLATFSGEASDFCRFNGGLIRQAGSVEQRFLGLELIQGKRHAKMSVSLSGQGGDDRVRVDQTLERLRAALPSVPEDPYLLYSTQVCSGERIGENRLPPREDAIGQIVSQSQGKDMVGIFAQGGIFAGFANSLGQRNWQSTYSFHFDWSLYHQGDKAVKTSYADFAWNGDEFAAKMRQAAEQLDVLRQRAKTIEPGQYRVYLAPQAMSEFVGLLCWGGFGLKSHRTRNTSLLKLALGEAAMNPMVTIRENTREGLSPIFQSAGFIRPDDVVLIREGKQGDLLTSARSAREYDVPTNGAGDDESPESLDLCAGDLDAGSVLSRLDRGVYVSQLWYLNYSDRPQARITGMTRFATFWVEGGRIVAPLNVMRFDETVYRVLGENLIGMTKQRELLPSASTYGGRSTGSARMPGALVEGFAFTL